ncbi:MAG TPA: response regulator [Bacteroidaceae bacterium]|nr:response regulator [Bacteroidaceae bacterium]
MISYKLIEIMLSRVNLKLLHAWDGREAVKYCEEYPDIDLVLMDMQLPVLNGIEATKEIARIRPDLPVIAATANAFAEDYTACIGAGCKGYVVKPIAFEKLFTLMESILKEAG